jgi:hypothetical protein
MMNEHNFYTFFKQEQTEESIDEFIRSMSWVWKACLKQLVIQFDGIDKMESVKIEDD